MDTNIQRSLADQSRLLLRDEYARDRLERGATEVRTIPASSFDAKRSQPCNPMDVQRARRWASPGRGRRLLVSTEERSRRVVGRRLLCGERALQVQKSLRRVELESSASFAADR